MFFVEARYHRDPSRVGAQVHYISHREEGLVGGQRRELFGIGVRYRALRAPALVRKDPPLLVERDPAEVHCSGV